MVKREENLFIKHKVGIRKAWKERRHNLGGVRFTNRVIRGIAFPINQS